MIETTRPELVAYQKERLAKFVGENEKLNKGQIVFAGDSITEFFALKKYLGRDFPLVNRGIAGTDSVWLLEHLKEQVLDLESSSCSNRPRRGSTILSVTRVPMATMRTVDAIMKNQLSVASTV